ncbi:hypothetical protein [Pseudonocardia cypriaca]|uniref:Uncharacterized protein n=1 Tax=Pseudonocardia cypriaca TaxID=882449 RepID=A0A543GBJ3_9PSEU|nr:hypothetical protein [Pseudonocardia cypriaca]TQM43374.1 hypothetical protein FB388_0719 [Pseudonocardia cypriaca]
MTVMDDRLREHATEIVPGDRSGGPSTSQTIMVSSLSTLLQLLPPEAPANSYRIAVIDENVLGKRTAGAREWAFRQLRRFYVLDPASLLFRALRDLWPDPEPDRPLLAMLCAMARDPVLRASAPMVLASDIGTVIGPDDFEKMIDETFPGAYRASTRRGTAQKLASSWQQSGHLDAQTPSRKIRARATSSPSTLAYALLLGHLQGVRGAALLETPWAQVLDQPRSRLVDLGVAASQRGMLEFRHAGGLIDVSFHELLRPFDDDGQLHL